ncbi:MAG TPA: hypothetical protein VGY77_03470 [Gemmataceae bacterium]|nr:hypothetical protein [Gemmataceae bacterium]
MYPATYGLTSLGEECMDPVHDDRFVVFLRFDATRVNSFADVVEEPLAACSSYGEARKIRKLLQGTAPGDCVIRFMGDSGGGD